MDQQLQAVPMGSHYQGEKKGMPVWGIALIVVGCFVILGVPLLTGVLYMWNISMADIGGDESTMAYEVRDGVNEDAENGCFFTIRANKGVDIDPTKYFFAVCEQRYAPWDLDFDFRENGGDRNMTLRYDNKDWRVEEDRPETPGETWFRHSRGKGRQGWLVLSGSDQGSGNEHNFRGFLPVPGGLIKNNKDAGNVQPSESLLRISFIFFLRFIRVNLDISLSTRSRVFAIVPLVLISEAFFISLNPAISFFWSSITGGRQ